MSSANTLPLVSCIMPTFNRRPFVPLAVRYFLRQDYPHKELLVVDDGTDPVADLLPADERIRYVRLNDRMTVGAKRNLACEQARGEIIVHWDDDDWSADWRLSYQVEQLQRSGADLCGLSRVWFYEPGKQCGWQYTCENRARAWVCGGTLAFRREFRERNPFPEVNIGEDTRFVWADSRARILALANPDFYVAFVHGGNTSPKRTNDSSYHPEPVERIQSLISSAPVTECTTAVPRPIRNLYACLVHEQPECILDLVRNLQWADPDSTILIYNSSNKPDLLSFPFDRYGVHVVPKPQRLAWGHLHPFALDCMRYALEQLSFETLTIVDSDQLALRKGYSQFLASFLNGRPEVGLLGNSPQRQPPTTRIGPAATAYQEIELWRPFLKRFDRGEDRFVHWSFWPSTIIIEPACRALLKLFDSDAQLKGILSRSKLWATEEILFPTLTALLGFRVEANPCSYDVVKYRQAYTPAQVDCAAQNPNVFWVHPVPRQYGHPLRMHVRQQRDNYRRPLGPPRHCRHGDGDPLPPFFLTTSVLKQMKGIEGWLEDSEADVLIEACRRCCAEHPSNVAILEVGSYCGRATVVLASVIRQLSRSGKVYALDNFDGRVGALDSGIRLLPPTREKFQRNLEAAGIVDLVEVHPRNQRFPKDIRVHLLLIDGLHDFPSVARDFFEFEPMLLDGAYVLFHDCADYFPGVQAFLHELLLTPDYREVARSGSMVALRRELKRGPVGPKGFPRS